MAKRLTSAADGTHCAITVGLNVEATTERGSFWGELVTMLYPF